MKSDDIKQTIVIKTEHMDRKTHLGLRSLITKYYFNFGSITEDNTDFKTMHEVKLQANFHSIGQMFDFNKELQEILL